MKNLLDRVEEELLYSPETKFLAKVRNIVAGAALYIMWATFIFLVFKTFIPGYNHIETSINFQYSKEYIFVSMCLFAPIFEEIFFRLPIRLLKNVNIKEITVIVVIFSSALFGVMHSGKFWSIPVQGVGD